MEGKEIKMKINYHKQAGSNVAAPVAANDIIINEVENEIKRGHVINCDRLNVRDQPNSNSAIICVLVRNTKVVIEPDYQLAEENDWFHITTEIGVDGFVKSEYIEVI